MEKKIIVKKLLTNPKIIMLLAIILFSILSINTIAGDSDPGKPWPNPDPLG